MKGVTSVTLLSLTFVNIQHHPHRSQCTNAVTLPLIQLSHVARIQPNGLQASSHVSNFKSQASGLIMIEPTESGLDLSIMLSVSLKTMRSNYFEIWFNLLSCPLLPLPYFPLRFSPLLFFLFFLGCFIEKWTLTCF